jgi:tight adherence protein B
MLFVYVIAVLAFFTLAQGLLSLRDGDAPKDEAPGPSLRRKTLLDDGAPWLAGFLLSAPIRFLDDLVQTSGMKRPTSAVLIFMCITTTAVMFAVSFTGLTPLLCLGAGIAVGIVVPFVALLRLRRKRFAKVADQLPEAIGMLVRALQAGHPIPAGIKVIAQQMPDPLGGELQKVHEAMSYGLDLRAALEKLTQRLPIEELHYMVAAIRIQYGAGGSLAGVLSLLANVMRERKKLRMKVIAMSAESRWSGYILAAIPVLLVSAVAAINPDYYKDVHTNQLLLYILIFAGLMVVGGMIMVKSIVNIKV